MSSVMWKKPKELRYPVEILDTGSEYIGQIGWVFATRSCDDTVMVYFPVTKTKGNIHWFPFEQVKKI